jgi:hypothetical protein
MDFKNLLKNSLKKPSLWKINKWSTKMNKETLKQFQYININTLKTNTGIAIDHMFYVNQHFIIKITTFNKPGFEQQFKNEIKVGTKPNIENVGVQTHAWFKTKDYGIQIMDNAIKGNEHHKSIDLTNYKKTFTTEFYKLFAKNLLTFYKTTQGFHGDLHDQNVLIILNKKTNKVVNIIIIDYETFVPFKHKIPNNATLRDAWIEMEKTWKSLKGENMEGVYKTKHGHVTTRLKKLPILSLHIKPNFELIDTYSSTFLKKIHELNISLKI